MKIFLILSHFIFGIIFFFFGAKYSSMNAKAENGNSFVLIDKNECDSLLLKEKSKYNYLKAIYQNNYETVKLLLVLDAIKEKVHNSKEISFELSQLHELLSGNSNFTSILRKNESLFKVDHKNLKTINEMIAQIDEILQEKSIKMLGLKISKSGSDEFYLLKIKQKLQDKNIQAAYYMFDKINNKEKYKSLQSNLKIFNQLYSLLDEIQENFYKKFESID
jgi:hypothetical protein